MARHPDVVIVGAGIVGAACAYYLARASLRVLVLESAFAGAGATAAAMGHIVVMDDSEAQFALTAYSRRLWAELGEEAGERFEDDPCGTIWVAADAEELALAGAKADFYRRRGVAATLLAPAELRRLEPELQADLAGGLQVPDDRVIYPPGAARWLLERAVAAGAELREGCEVLALEGRSVVCADGRIDAAQVVNAAGSQAARLTAGLPIEPRKGHLVVTDRYPGFCRHQLVELGYLKSAHGRSTESVAFNLQPRRSGQLLVGSSRELVGWDRRINRRLVEAMLERARRFVPRLLELLALRIWVGFRPTTPDNLPLIGRWPAGETGPWIAAGHQGLGITTALGTGRLLTDLLTGGEAELDPAPFDPARHGGAE